MAAPIRFLTGRQQQQKIGVIGSTEDTKVLEVIGRVGIGTTIFDSTTELDIRGNTHISGKLGIGITNPTSRLHLSGIGSTDPSAPDEGNRIRIGDYHWDDTYTTIHAKKISSEWWLEQNSPDEDGVDLIFYKSRGVPNAEEPVQVGDNLFRLTARAFKPNAVGIGTTIRLSDYGGDYAGQIEFNVDTIDGNNVASSIDIRNSNESRLIIKGDGKIGIGSTLPTANLDVVGSTELDNLNVSGIATIGTFNVSGVTTFTDTVSFGTSAYFGDNDRLFFGDGNDLQIYHNGSNSIIEDTGDGELLLRTNGNRVRIQSSDLDDIARFNKDGSVELYYDNSKKFETTGVGVSIVNGTSETATIYGPSNLIIDPMPVGVGTTSGIVRIKGDLYVDGTQFTVASSTIELADFVVGIATTVPNDLLLDGAGIGIGTNKTFLYEYNSGTNPSLKSSENLNVASGKGYQINQTEVLNATTLGSGVTNSSLTSVGTLSSLNVSGVSTFQSDIHLGDNDRIYLGTSDDLEIFHNGHGVIRDNGTGNLYLQSNGTGVYIQKYDGGGTNDNLARFITDGAVELYYDNSPKFETTGYGVTVSGSAYISGIATATSFESTVSTGTAPFVVASTTKVTNLNADLLDGKSTANGASGNTVVIRNAAGGFDASDVNFANITASGDLNVSGIATITTIDATNATIDNLTFTSGTAITSVDTDLASVSGSDDTLASAKAIKTYVDSQVTAQDLDFAGDTGTGAIDLDSETLTIAGTTNEIETVGSGNTITIGLPNVVAITTSLTVGDATGITGGAPADQGVLSVYTSGGKNALIVQTSDNSNSRGIAFRNAADAYIGYISMENVGSNKGDMVFGVTDNTETDVNNVDERLRITSAGDVGIGSVTPTEKLDVAGNIAINQTTVVGSATSSLSTVTETAIHTGLSTSTYRSVEYNIQATQGTNFHVTKILALHNGTTAYHNEYGTIFNNTSVSTFNVDVSGGNIRLLATGASASQTDYVVNFTATKI